ncbi:MAG: RnfABCDGE type electron transport complex subunit D [Leptospiraceae bacterium]|nr:RnfABCDGE type electron transport complex subunit D [Leptospiraceae bacterium]
MILKLKNFFFKDIRVLQIVLMLSLLGIGVFIRDFSIHLEQILLTFISGILTQILWIRFLNISERGILSAIISCTGLSLLLRSDTIWVHPLIAFIIISSKFLIRYQGKHIFNPAMFGVILGITLFPGNWVSPGQWGTDLTISIWLIIFGFFVASRATVSLVSISFFLAYSSFILIRVLYFGYDLKVFFHQMNSGSLLLFTFFMITDPRTLPNQEYVKIFHAVLVAFLAFVWQYYFFKQVGLIWSLFFCSLLVPIWDTLFPKTYFDWKSKPEYQ